MRPIALHAAEEALDLVSLLIESAIIAPGIDAIGLGRHDRDHAEREHQLPGLVAFVGAIHQQRQTFWHWPQFAQQLTSFRRVMRVTGRCMQRSCGRSLRRCAGEWVSVSVGPYREAQAVEDFVHGVARYIHIATTCRNRPQRGFDRGGVRAGTAESI
jgi:hypothetical protein